MKRYLLAFQKKVAVWAVLGTAVVGTASLVYGYYGTEASRAQIRAEMRARLQEADRLRNEARGLLYEPRQNSFGMRPTKDPERISKAHGLLDLAQKLDPDALDNLDLRSAIHLAKRENRDAKLVCELILKLDPRQSEAWWRLATVQQREGDYAGAVVSMEAFQRLCPDPPRHEVFGEMAALACNWKLAEEHLSKAAFRDPNNSDILAQYAVVLSVNGKDGEAARCLGMLSTPKFMDQGSMINVALAYSNLGNQSKALEAFRKVDLDIMRPRDFQIFGPLLYESGCYEEAVVPLERFLLSDPKDYDAMNLLMLTYYHLGRVSEASAIRARMRDIKPQPLSVRLPPE